MATSNMDSPEKKEERKKEMVKISSAEKGNKKGERTSLKKCHYSKSGILTALIF